MPEKVLTTKTPPKQSAKAAKARRPPKSPAVAKRRRVDPFYLNTREEREERNGKNWLPKEKSRDWLKGS